MTRGLAAGLVASLLACQACGSKKDTEPTPVASGAPEPTDPNDLVEGPVQAMGLTMPLGSRIRAQDAIGFAIEIPMPMERVANYFRTRLKSQKVLTGPNRTIFVGVTPPAGEDRLLHLVVRRKGVGSEVYVSYEAPTEVAEAAPMPVVAKATLEAEGLPPDPGPADPGDPVMEEARPPPVPPPP